MTIKEIYEWAKEHNAEDYKMIINYPDDSKRNWLTTDNFEIEVESEEFVEIWLQD